MNNPQSHGMTKTLSHRLRRGVVALEFAFVAPILVALIIGVIQYGLIAQATTIVTNLSREGARFGAASADSRDDDIREYVRDIADTTPLKRDDLTITITPDENKVGEAVHRQAGDRLTVTVTYNMKSRLFVPGAAYILEWFRKSETQDPSYSATAIMRILN